MRINQTFIPQNFLNDSLQADALKALIGKVLDGQVVAADGKLLTFQYQGQLLQLLNTSETAVEIGSQIQLQVTAQEEGVLLAQIVSEMPLKEGEMLTMGASGIDIKNPDVQQAIEALKTLNLPVTQENLQTLKQGMLEVKMLLSALPTLSDSEVQSLLAKTDAPIKQFVLTLVQSDVKTEMPVQSETTLQTQAQSQPQVQHTEIPVAQTSVQAEAAASQTQTQSLPQSESAIQESIEKFSVLLKEMLSAEKTDAKEALKILLENFDYSKDSLLLKQALPVTLKNLLFVDNQQSQVKTLGDSMVFLSEVARHLPLESEQLQQLVQVLKDEVSTEEKLAVIERLIVSSTLDESVKKAADKEINFVREAVRFTPNYNDQVVYMQIPLKLESQQKTVDLYFKARHKKIDPDNMTLLVALETIRYGEVRCVVQKTGTQYGLNFSLETPAAKNAFEKQAKILETALEGLNVGQFDLRFSVNSETVEHFYETSSRDVQHSIDIRV